MKISRTLLFVALAAVGSIASAKTVEMDVHGLVCAFCAQGVTKSLKAFPASDEVYVSLENKIVAVTLKDGQDIADPALKKAITDAGFKVVAIRRTDESLADIKARGGKKKAAAGTAKGDAHDADHKHDANHKHDASHAHDEKHDG